MAPIRFVMVGGFLGAGKTTTIARLAAMFQQQGQRVGIVTNDQGTDLVDTRSLRSQGFEVGEISGACFCADLSDLVGTVERLGKLQRPDVILSEPVGSCTDLVSTVIQPLERLFEERFCVAPYAVILKPSHGARILSGHSKAGFSPKAEYIFRKQLEEADLILVNRIDDLPANEVEQLMKQLAQQYPDTPALRVSARTGAGFDQLFSRLLQPAAARRALELDYETYAAAESELAWLNSSLRVRSNAPVSLDELLLAIVTNLCQNLRQQGAEPAHVKAIGLCSESFGVANVVSSWTPAELSAPSGCQVRAADIILNARVAIDPVSLKQLAQAAVDSAGVTLGATLEVRHVESFRPGESSTDLVQISL